MTKDTNITCPKCGAEIPLTEAVSHRIREQLAGEFEIQRQEQNAALQRREDQLTNLNKSLQQREQGISATVAAQVEAAKKQLSTDAARAAQEKVAGEIKDLQSQVSDQRAKLKAAGDAELELRNQKRQLEDDREKLDLELARRLDAERKKIGDAVREQVTEADRLKLAEKDGVIDGLKIQIEALRQRVEQGSMQLQGETLELTLENDLRQAFPMDEISEVKKGERGADILQRVRANAGLECGSILWEAKRARNWSAPWIAKLKSDQRDAKSELAVLVTTSPPEGLRGIGLFEGVWVCEPVFACVLAAALRQGLVAAAVQRVQQTGQLDKRSQVYDYVCGIEFRQHLEGIVESFKGLQEQLCAEQRAFARQWKEREQQLTKALRCAAMLYGSIQGIAGREALPQIQTLQLPGASEDES